MKSKGRPKLNRELETLNFSSFLEDISMFRNYLLDVSEDNNDIFNEEPEDPNKPIIRKFLSLETWKQNLYIVYLLNKDKRVKNNTFTFKALADLLQVNRAELMRAIRNIKECILSETDEPIGNIIKN